jgi:signal transduction histidine kinase
MVYRTVQLHDGEIEVQSSPGKGTAFRVTLPRA